jgi:flagellum-specific peptidoglycan hydrolase FlgJ
MTVKEFVYAYVSHANRVAVQYNVPSLVTLAQAAWESGWGTHAPKYNFFGMTAGSNYTGKTQTLYTYEYKNGVKVKVAREFRAYDSPLMAFSDYANNIRNSGNYTSAFKYIHDPAQFFREVFENGYATDPNYYTSVMQVMAMIKKYVI